MNDTQVRMPKSTAAAGALSLDADDMAFEPAPPPPPTHPGERLVAPHDDKSLPPAPPPPSDPQPPANA